jgi:hypothetical protein
MANVKEYWDAVNAEASRLPAFCWLVSLDTREGGKGGVMVHVTGANAAKALVARTHRIATPEEIAQHEGKAQETRDEVNALFERQRLLLQPLVQAMKPQPQPPVKGRGEK